MQNRRFILNGLIMLEHLGHQMTMVGTIGLGAIPSLATFCRFLGESFSRLFQLKTTVNWEAKKIPVSDLLSLAIISLFVFPQYCAKHVNVTDNFFGTHLKGVKMSLWSISVEGALR